MFSNAFIHSKIVVSPPLALLIRPRHEVDNVLDSLLTLRRRPHNNRVVASRVSVRNVHVNTEVALDVLDLSALRAL